MATLVMLQIVAAMLYFLLKDEHTEGIYLT